MSNVFFRDMHHSYPVAAEAGGMYITDTSGKSYLDMCGGAAVSCLGHQHPNVIKALQDQIGRMAFAHTAFFSNEPQEKLAEMLAGKFGEDGAKVYLTAGGSEANETALKLAWQYWRALGQGTKTKIISRTHSYHGNTLGTLSVSGHPGRRVVMEDVLVSWPRIAPCYAYRHQETGETDAAYGKRSADLLEQAILDAGPETVAAFIVEPVVGASLGAVVATEGYFKRIREICNQYDVLLISDEIMCGTGRTGTFFAHEQEGFLPDIVTLAKGIGAGYQPLAATIARAKIADIFSGENKRSFEHGHTYVGHASTCAAGVAVLETIEHYQLLGAVRTRGDAFQAVLEDKFGDHPNVGEIRGRGLFRALELVSDKSKKTPIENSALVAKNIRTVAMKHGMLCYPSGGDAAAGYSGHILFAPPYILQESHISEMADKLQAVMQEVFGV